jgi:hypothetical protein
MSLTPELSDTRASHILDTGFRHAAAASYGADVTFQGAMMCRAAMCRCAMMPCLMR